jgi:hypothetical protein
MLEKTKRANKNEQSRDIGPRQTKCKNTTQKTTKMRNTDSTKYWMNPGAL